MPVIILAGVTAVGKTCTAKILKNLYDWDYIEADEYHPQSNIDKMKEGNALTDEDRLPWLRQLHEQLKAYSSVNRNCIMTCSALKKVYRRILLTGSTYSNAKEEIPTENVYFILLTLSREMLHKRLLLRQHEHFMNPVLLDSQLETLELPNNQADEPNTYVIDCNNLSQDDIVHQIENIIK